MRILMLILAALATAAFTQMPNGVADPRAFVADRFATYARAPNDPPPEPDLVYSPRLTNLFTLYHLWAGEHPDLVGSLDFDWWTNAQDWQISNVSIVEYSAGADRKVIEAQWRNYDRTDSSRFFFVRENGRWFLDEVVNGSGRGDDGWTLSALLQQREE